MDNNETTIRRAGGSLTLTIPMHMARAMGFAEGQKVALAMEDDRLVATSAKRKRPKYTLQELLAQCDPNAPLDADSLAWMNAPSVGMEILPPWEGPDEDTLIAMAAAARKEKQ